jgi:hypothetical protein
MSNIARIVLVVIALVCPPLVCPADAGAQIASVVRPPGQRHVPVKAEPYDTGTVQVRHPTTQLTDLTAWVDSAVVANQGAGDTSNAAPATASPTKTEVAPRGAAARPASAVRFHNGASAPDTASLLPAMVIVGVVTLGLGLIVNARARHRV